jgi:membrane protein required for colicin V production
MIGIDILLAAVVILSCVIGVMRGLIRELISLVSWIVGLWCAWRFAYIVEPELGGVLADRPLSLWAARSLVLIGILVVGGIVGGIVGYLIRHSALGWLDRLLGIFFGLLRGLVLVGLVAIIGSLLQLTGGPAWHDAQLTSYAEAIGDVLKALVDDAGQSLKSPAG